MINIVKKFIIGITTVSVLGIGAYIYINNYASNDEENHEVQHVNTYMNINNTIADKTNEIKKTYKEKKADIAKQEETKSKEEKKEVETNKKEETKQVEQEKPVEKSQSNGENKKNNTEYKEEKKMGLAEQIASTNIAQVTDQLILVSEGKLSLWNKSDGKWNKAMECANRLGYNGLSDNKHEGDGTTPTGVYPITLAFGLGQNPGTSLEYRQITDKSYYVDDVNSDYYNKWYEGDGQTGEHMKDYYQYKYGLVIGYNLECIKGKGSGIFVHCNGAGSTAGCVSISEGDMLNLIKSVHSGVHIIITSSNNNLKYY